MGIKLNHTIIQAKNAEESAKFLAEILGLASPTSFGPFIVVKTENEVSLDFRTTSDEIKPRHFAFIVSEAEFDEIFNRITQKQLMVRHESALPLVAESATGKAQPSAFRT